MPTLSAKSHIEFHKKEVSFHSTHEKRGVDEIPLTILDSEDKILPEVSQICRLIARADIILATGHLYLKEVKALVHEAGKQGVKKILINHPEFILNASIDDMVELANQGAFIEHSYTLTYSKKLTKEYLFEMIRAVGAEHTVIGSDLGQTGRPYPIDGFRDFIKDMLGMGMKDEEVHYVLRANPAKLLNLE